MRNKLLTGVIVALGFCAIAYAAATKFTSVNVTDDLTVGKAATFNGTVVLPVVNVVVSTPTIAGSLVRTSANVIYVATGTVTPSQWVKVGAQ